MQLRIVHEGVSLALVVNGNFRQKRDFVMNEKRYDGFARALHWLMAILIILMMVVGVRLEDLTPAARTQPLTLHSGIGLVLLLLVIIRLWWRHKHPAPPYPQSMSSRQQKLAKLVVYGFYGLMIFQPVVGLMYAATHLETQVSPFGLINLTALLPSETSLNQVFGTLHGLGFSLLALLIIGHTGAALKHWLMDKDEIPSRMVPFVKSPKRD